jgi:hypothetical protein
VKRRPGMEPHVLTDKRQFPTEEIIFAHLGKSKVFWLSLFEYIHTNHPDLSEEWRYYNDGKSWLLKVKRKKKTVFWLSVVKDAFRTTFYFTDRANGAIADSSISDELKEQFASGKRFGAIRGLTVTYKNKKAVADAQKLIALKISLK